MYAGIRFTRDPVSGNLTLFQKTFAENLVKKFGVTRSKATPMAVGLMLASQDEDEQIDMKLFRSLIGHLMWLANQTRPDILNAVRSLARYCNAPTLRHWKAALHVLMYVRGTLDFGITFEHGGDLRLVLYVDADFASRETGRKSVSGGLLMCAKACAGYFSKTQQSVTTATKKTRLDFWPLSELATTLDSPVSLHSFSLRYYSPKRSTRTWDTSSWAWDTSPKK